MGKRSPINLLLFEQLLSCNCKYLKKTLAGLRKTRKDSKVFIYLMKLNSCLTLLLDHEEETLRDKFIKDIPKFIHVEMPISYLESTMLPESEAHYDPVAGYIHGSSSRRDRKNNFPQVNKFNPFKNRPARTDRSLTNKDSSSGTNRTYGTGGTGDTQQLSFRSNQLNTDRTTLSQEQHNKLMEKKLNPKIDNHFDDQMSHFVNDLEQIDMVLKEFHKSKLDKKSTQEELRQALEQQQKEEEQNSDSESYDSMTASQTLTGTIQEAMNDSIDSFNPDNHEDVEMRILESRDWKQDMIFNARDALASIRELQPMKIERKIPKILMYETFDNILGPINGRNFPKMQIEELTDFEIIMKEKQRKRQIQTNDKVIIENIDEELGSTANFNLDIHRKFKDDFLSHLKTKEKKLKARLKMFEEEERQEMELARQDKIQKEKRRGGWKSQRAKRQLKKPKIPPAFAAKQIDLTQEISVKPELFKFFDPEKVPDTIENVEVEEMYEDAIPDEDLFLDDGIGFDEKDNLGFQENTFFTEMNSIIEREQKNGVCAYEDKGAYFDMIRLTDMSTQASEPGNSRCSSILDQTELFTPVSMKRMVKNRIQQNKLEIRKNQKEWCFTARVVPRNWFDESFLFLNQQSRKGFKKKCKQDKVKDYLARYKSKYLPQDFIEFIKEEAEDEIKNDLIY